MKMNQIVLMPQPHTVIFAHNILFSGVVLHQFSCYMCHGRKTNLVDFQILLVENWSLCTEMNIS